MGEPTPGPWTRDIYTITGPDGLVVARCGAAGRSVAEQVANGRLVHAAPELLYEVQIVADRIEADLDDMTCDAGNPDGGSPESCEHCQMRRYLSRLQALIARATRP